MTVHCGPMRCRGCGHLVVWGVAPLVLQDDAHSVVLTRGFYERLDMQPGWAYFVRHRCSGKAARAA